MANKRVSVGIVAPSAAVPTVELQLGVQKMKDSGLAVKVHSQCKKRSMFYAGLDSERAQAFYEYAISGEFSVIWSARGGSGACRILPWLEKLTSERGIPEKKLLVGYSDSTSLHEFVRNRWDWSTLHAAMPGLREFLKVSPAEWNATVALVRGQHSEQPWGKKKLKFLGPAPKGNVRGEIVGGNLTVWNSMTGTPFAPKARGRILFFEDIGESGYRLDRMVQQLAQAGGLEGVIAIVLGDFVGCEDVVPSALKSMPKPSALKRVLNSPKPSELAPIRPALSSKRILQDIFGSMGECLGIPVAYGLPIGHGNGHYPLPLGAQVELGKDGSLRLLSWDWA
jgi:muramoyltetrapeptide carboxypeptidase